MTASASGGFRLDEGTRRPDRVLRRRFEHDLVSSCEDASQPTHVVTNRPPARSLWESSHDPTTPSPCPDRLPPVPEPWRSAGSSRSWICDDTTWSRYPTRSPRRSTPISRGNGERTSRRCFERGTPKVERLPELHRRRLSGGHPLHPTSRPKEPPTPPTLARPSPRPYRQRPNHAGRITMTRSAGFS